MISLDQSNIESVVTVGIWLVFLSGGLSALLLLMGPAPYGRYHTDQSLLKLLGLKRLEGLAVAVPGRLCWIVMESPNVVAVAIVSLLLHQEALPSRSNVILVAMFTVHYIYRAFIYPFLQTNKPGTLITFVAALLFCSINGFNQAASLLILHRYENSWLSSVRFICGSALFAFGLLTNIYSDHVLRVLRPPGETGYKIPRGGMFKYVSCANYFGEIIEWLGFAIACWNMASASFVFFTACNLIPRALSHHRFYLHKMTDYPKDRKAVIPFVL